MAGPISGFGGQQQPQIATAAQKPGVANDEQLRSQQANDQVANNQQVARNQNNIAAPSQDTNTDYRQDLPSQEDVANAVASRNAGEDVRRGSLVDIQA